VILGKPWDTIDPKRARPLCEAAVAQLDGLDYAERLTAIQRGEFPPGLVCLGVWNQGREVAFAWGGKLLCIITAGQLRRPTWRELS
jgi:hypothetical protein